MAILIFLIIALLVAVSLITLNMRSLSPRREETVDMDSTKDETPESDDPTALIMPQEENETSEIKSDKSDDQIMKDSDYRLALKQMHIQVQESSVSEPEDKKENVMKDSDYREMLRSMSEQKDKS